MVGFNLPVSRAMKLAKMIDRIEVFPEPERPINKTFFLPIFFSVTKKLLNMMNRRQDHNNT